MDTVEALVFLLKYTCILPCFTFFLLFLLQTTTQLVASVLWTKARAHFSWQPESSFLEHHHRQYHPRLVLYSRLRVSHYTPLRSSKERESCVVCLCEMKEGDEIRELKCFHLFHKDCLDRWAVDVERTSTCPLCRRDLVDQEEEEEEDDGGYCKDDSSLSFLLYNFHSSTW